MKEQRIMLKKPVCSIILFGPNIFIAFKPVWNCRHNTVIIFFRKITFIIYIGLYCFASIKYFKCGCSRISQDSSVWIFLSLHLNDIDSA